MSRQPLPLTWLILFSQGITNLRHFVETAYSTVWTHITISTTTNILIISHNYHISQLFAHITFPQQQLTLSYYHTTKYHATKWGPKRCMYRQDRCVRDFFASVFFIKLHQNREVLIGMRCIESLQGVLYMYMRKLTLKEGFFVTQLTSWQDSFRFFTFVSFLTG